VWTFVSPAPPLLVRLFLTDLENDKCRARLTFYTQRIYFNILCEVHKKYLVHLGGGGSWGADVSLGGQLPLHAPPCSYATEANRKSYYTIAIIRLNKGRGSFQINFNTFLLEVKNY
jgi:hypothetical protein